MFIYVTIRLGDNMNIYINTVINPNNHEIKVTLETPVINEQVTELIKQLNSTKDELIAKKDGKIYIFKVNDISEFYSFGKNVFLKHNNIEYETAYRLYELEELLPKEKFIRISHSCIVNRNKIAFFDTNIIGEILVKMTDGNENFVSKRRIKEIMSIIKGGK